MKNLANCTPSEFLKQTVRLRKSLEKWVKSTDIINIRKTLPTLTDEMTDEEKRVAIKEQGKKNLLAIIDVAMEKCPDETLEVLALACFVEPENVDDHTMSEYILSILEMVQDECVVSFFTFLLKLGKIDTSSVLNLSA